MSTNLPSKLTDLIEWAVTHVDLFTTNQAQIGVSSQQVLQFKGLTTALQAAKAAADAARQASKNATMIQDDAESQLRTTAGALVNVIKAYAQSTGKDSVYALAGVSPDSPRGVLPPPVAPERFEAAVNGDGSLTIRWKVTQPAGVTGVTYRVMRRLAPASTFSLIGTAGSKKAYTDLTLPLGVDKVEYLVQPTRGETMGPQSNIFTVQFGSIAGGGGGTFSIVGTESVPHAMPMKVAA